MLKVLSRQLYQIPISVRVDVTSYFHYGRCVYFRMIGMNRCKKNLQSKAVSVSPKSEAADITAKVSLNTSGC